MQVYHPIPSQTIDIANLYQLTHINREICTSIHAPYIANERHNLCLGTMTYRHNLCLATNLTYRAQGSRSWQDPNKQYPGRQWPASCFSPIVAITGGDQHWPLRVGRWLLGLNTGPTGLHLELMFVDHYSLALWKSTSLLMSGIYQDDRIVDLR